MKNRQNSIEEARRVISATLQKIPGVTDIRIDLEPFTEKYKADLHVSFRKQDDRKILLVEVGTSGQPRPARTAVNQLMALQQNRPGIYGVFAAPYISDVSAEICKNSGISYIDFAGNCWLNFDPIFIEVSGNPNLPGVKRELKSLFKPKAERILRVLLHEPGRQWSTVELAETAEVSIGQVSNVRNLLLEREWIQDQKQGIKLTRPLQLLEAWLAEYQPARNSSLGFYNIDTTGQIEATIEAVCNRTQTRYALTGFSGAARYAPFTTYKTVAVYMDDMDAKNFQDLPFKPVTSGANIKIITPYDEGVYHGCQKIRGQTVVSAIQCYLDLKDEKARGEEAAEALFEQEVKPLWQ